MKLTTPFSVIKNALSDIKRVPKEVKHSFWDQECQDHPTNSHCLVYCD